MQIWTSSMFYTAVATFHSALEKMVTFSARYALRNKKTTSLSTSAFSWFSVFGTDVFLFTWRLPAGGRNPALKIPAPHQYSLLFLVQLWKPQHHWLVSTTELERLLSKASHMSPRPETIGATGVRTPKHRERLSSQESLPVKPVCWERLANKRTL